MKKALTPLIFTLFSANTFAAQDGTADSWDNNDNLVNLNCIGTLTAAHCLDDQYLQFSDGKFRSSTNRTNHPNYVGNSGFDVALLILDPPAQSQHSFYFADLTNDPLTDKEHITFWGFGGTDEHLHYATQEIDEANTSGHPTAYMYMRGVNIGQGSVDYGDSGGPWLNVHNAIIAVTSKGSSYGDNLHYAKDFILDTINGWHYLTVANTSSGQVTIKVQSLHQNPVVDSAYTSGDAKIIGGTCQSAGTSNAFATCDYVIENQGGEGTLHLNDSESISINPQTNSDGNSSGGAGSLCLLSAVALMTLGLRRRFLKG
ncbi:trypsin-like serine protease [Vibrio maritimus]|uniref:trypsin-like serine protease n=1 Tax=Vibrio maritimus TaxID=990268 RepID=UPI001F1EDEF8|nr:trypsin-like serine protease [Vibrio maritimus]